MNIRLIGFGGILAISAMSGAQAQESNIPATASGPANVQTNGAADTSGQGGVVSGSADQGQSAEGLTRAQVRQQLIQSERDGQLKALQTGLYKGA